MEADEDAIDFLALLLLAHDASPRHPRAPVTRGETIRGGGWGVEKGLIPPLLPSLHCAVAENIGYWMC